MIFRSGTVTKVGRRVYHSSQVEVRCAFTNEKLGQVYEADTTLSYLYYFVLNKAGKIKMDKTVKLPDGSMSFPWRINRIMRPFKVVERKTGKVIAKSS